MFLNFLQFEVGDYESLIKSLPDGIRTRLGIRSRSEFHHLDNFRQSARPGRLWFRCRSHQRDHLDYRVCF